MNVWAMDFDAHSVVSIDPSALGEVTGPNRFCWLDLSAEEYDSAREHLSDTRMPDQFGNQPLPDLLIDDTWVAFGLAEPGDHAGAAPHGSAAANEPHGRGVNLLFSTNLLVTCDFGNSDTLRRLRTIWREDFVRFARSPGFLLFEFGDHYISVAQQQLHRLEDRIQRLQRHLFGDADDSVFGDTAEAMQALYDFRRQIMGVQESFDELATRSSAFIPESTQPYLARCAVRLERIANELLQQSDGLMSGLNLYIGMNGHRTSLLLKRLTIVSMIFLPLSFMAGVFGMNFTHFPGIGFEHGFALFCLVCGLITLVLLTVARRGRWF